MDRKAMKMVAMAGFCTMSACVGLTREARPPSIERLDERGVSAPALDVEAQSVLQFVNADSRPHQIHSTDCAELSSGLLNPGDIWSVSIGEGWRVCHFEDLLTRLSTSYSGTVQVHDALAERRMVSPE